VVGEAADEAFVSRFESADDEDDTLLGAEYEYLVMNVKVTRL
jgi:hypothetical protein